MKLTDIWPGLKTLTIILGMTVMTLPAVGGTGIPDDLNIITEYQPGAGLAAGQVAGATDTAVILHAGENVAYAARKNLPIYEDDTLLTGEGGGMSIQLRDGSKISLGPSARLVIHKSLFDEENKNRTSFVSMLMGKARFWVKKLPGFNRADFKVKTQTVVVGVRGSDFVIDASEHFTTVQTLADTRLEVISLFARCENFDGIVSCRTEQYILNPFEQVTVERGDLVLEATPLPPGVRETLEDAFPEPGDPGPPLVMHMVIPLEAASDEEMFVFSPYDNELSEHRQEIIENLEKSLADYPEEPFRY